MATITAGDFRNGKTVQYDGNIWTVIEFQHVKPGKGSPFVRTKLKNLKTGGVIENSFNPTEKFEEAIIEKKDYQYLYNDGEFYYFMDTDTFEQTQLSAEFVGDQMKFVKDNEMVKLMSHNGDTFALEPPFFVELRVIETEPGVKGNTATNAKKPATVETGATLMVPLFIDIDDVIKIDTRTDEYMSRA